jgi:site-specific DNA-methyltransferase (adenine-specific)/adenine-specific DNA-methyltransferase
MSTLDWIGKKAVVDHHKEVPFHLLKCNDALSVGEGSLLAQDKQKRRGLTVYA